MNAVAIISVLAGFVAAGAVWICWDVAENLITALQRRRAQRPAKEKSTEKAPEES